MSDQYKVPQAWVDRVLDRLRAIFGNQYAEIYGNDQLMRVTWRSGLYGLHPDQIKSVLAKYARRRYPIPLNCIDFYHDAKCLPRVKTKARMQTYGRKSN